VEEAARSREQVVRIQASPVARRLAEAAGIDLAELAAQKRKRQPGERIKREDVEAAIAACEAAAAPPSPAPVVGEAMPVTHIRRLIAQRMVESTHTTAPLTLTTEADATELVALRERLKATLSPRGVVVPAYTDLIIRLTALALQEHPLLNAYWKEDEIIVPTGIHIAVRALKPVAVPNRGSCPPDFAEKRKMDNDNVGTSPQGSGQSGGRGDLKSRFGALP